MFNMPLSAQNNLPTVQYYYVEEKTPDLLKPISQNRLSDHSLELTFTRPSLQVFFENKKVYVYKKAFPGAINKRLQNMYLIGFDDFNLVNPLRDLNQVVYVDYIGTLEYESLGDNPPDDYDSTALIPTQNIYGPNGSPAYNVPGLPRDHLDLVNAPMAWNITQGDPNIAIGLVDGPFYPNHPDLTDKYIIHYGSPWNPLYGGSHQHGTKMAGVAAADTDNSLGIASIGYNTSLITCNAYNPNFTPPEPHPFDNASPIVLNMLFLAQNHPEIKVLTHSRVEGCNYIEADALAYEEIWVNYGITVITAGGNGNWKASCNDSATGDENLYVYPASYDHVISVSTVGHHYKYGKLNDYGIPLGWKDSHQFISGNDQFTFTHNDKIDIVAPGYYIPATDEDDKYSTGRGTSYSGPFVCGIAALMYAVHPNITPDEVRQILRDTADDIYHIPENQPYIGKLGTGRVNAYAAVRTAECLANPISGIDLITLNSANDFGDEPDSNTEVIWDSDDIWVRNQQDTDRLYKDCHQDPEYIDENTPVYVYVRVTNDGCTSSSGNDQLELYWAKGGLNQTWPTVWNGSSNPQLAPNGSTIQFDIGNQVGAQYIPPLDTGESTILEFEWYPENPSNYEIAGFAKPWMFCFLSRIVSSDDPMTSLEGENAAINTRNNNNIAYKNTTVINVNSNQRQGTIFAGNLHSQNQLQSNIGFFTNSTYNDRLWQEAEVYAELDQTLWNAWQDSGAQQHNIRVVNASERRILIVGNNASLNNVNFDSNEIGLISMSVNFLVREVNDFEGYDLHLQQTLSSTDEVLGGFTFTFTRDNNRQYFTANNEVEVDNDNTRILRAIDINEPATYNWYDVEGNLIYSGNEFSVNTAVAQEYKLEVIAENDGHKDYHTVFTEDVRGILSISPNPANDQVTIHYFIDEANTAIIMLTNTLNGTFYNYVLDSSTDNLHIDISNFTSGQYIVNLLSGSQVLDTKNLIIQ